MNTKRRSTMGGGSVETGCGLPVRGLVFSHPWRGRYEVMLTRTITW